MYLPALALGLALSASPTPAQDCLALYNGVGIATDLPAARRCLEVALAAPCDGRPADLARAQLAVMFFDGQGGPADPARALALFRGCAEDRTPYDLQRKFIAWKPTGAFNLCREILGSPSLVRECVGVEASLAAQAHIAAAQRLRAALSEAARAPLDAAEAAWARFLRAEADRVVDRVRTPDDALVRVTTLGTGERERAAWLETLPTIGEGVCSPRERASADARLERMLREAREGIDPKALVALQEAQDEWATYRAAEVRWMAAWKGAGVGSSAACMVVRMRAKMLEVHEPEDGPDSGDP